MAVHKRAYRPYQGAVTSARWRFLVLPRYSLLEMFESRVLTAFFAFCFAPFLVEAAALYVANSAAARAVLNLPQTPTEMHSAFFVAALTVQGVLAFLLTAWVSPVLVSPDLVNGALPLYLSRPFSRLDYVLGKASALAVILSAVTWAPGLFLFGLQSGLAGMGWFSSNVRIGIAIFAGSWIWIALLTLMGLAISAAIRWRLVASAAIVAVFFMGTAFGEMWHGVMRNRWGDLANLTYLIGRIWRALFPPGPPLFYANPRLGDLPTWVACLMLLVVASLSVGLLHLRLRAREVVS